MAIIINLKFLCLHKMWQNIHITTLLASVRLLGSAWLCGQRKISTLLTLNHSTRMYIMKLFICRDFSNLKNSWNYLRSNFVNIKTSIGDTLKFKPLILILFPCVSLGTIIQKLLEIDCWNTQICPTVHCR